MEKIRYIQKLVKLPMRQTLTIWWRHGVWIRQRHKLFAVRPCDPDYENAKYDDSIVFNRKPISDASGSD